MSRKGFGKENRDVEIPAGNVQLDGELIIPEGATGIVLFAHGRHWTAGAFSGKQTARQSSGGKRRRHNRSA